MNECLALLLVPMDGDTGAAGEGHMMMTGVNEEARDALMSRVTPCPLKIKFYYRFQGIGGPYALSSTGLGQVLGFAP